MHRLNIGGLVVLFSALLCIIVTVIARALLIPSLPERSNEKAQAIANAQRGGIVQAALLLSSRLTLSVELDDNGKPVARNGKPVLVWNNYDPRDPVLSDVIHYWKEGVCPDGTLCDLVRPGDLQCVSFIRGVLFMIGHPIALVGDGWQFYADPHNALSGWTKVPVGQMPMAGDIVSWSNGMNTKTGQANPGHVAIIVQARPPANGHAGDIVVADSNADGNYLNPISRQNSLLDLKLNPDLTLQSLPGYTLEGYRRPPASYLTARLNAG